MIIYNISYIYYVNKYINIFINVNADIRLPSVLLYLTE